MNILIATGIIVAEITLLVNVAVLVATISLLVSGR